MADGFHVNGTCLAYTSTGPGSTLELLGYGAAGGVDVQLNHNLRPIFTDMFGPETPHDMQDMGETAVITVPLMVSYRSVLKKILNRGDKGAQGQLNSPGLVMGQTGNAFSLGLTAPGDEPWLFYRCLCIPDARVKLGTVAQPFQIQFFAWPVAAYTLLSGQSAPLYARSLA